MPKSIPSVTRSYDELVTRTRWYVYLRWAILLLVVIPSLIASFFDVGFGERFLRDVLVCGFAIITNSVFHILTYTLKRKMSMKVLAYILVVTDVIIVTIFLHTKGGIESRSSILYVLPMIASAAILGRKGTYITTALSIIGFTVIILGAYYGVFGLPLSQVTPILDHDPGYVVNTIVFFDFILLVVALAIDYLTRLLIQREYEAQVALEQMRQAQIVAKTGTWEFDPIAQEVRYSAELRIVMSQVIRYDIITADEFIELVHPDDRTLVRRHMSAAIRKPRTYSFEHRMLGQNGGVYYLHIDGQSIADKSGKVTRIIGSARDITDEKSLQKARNDFVALASHQLRTPATIVKQYIGMLKDGFIGPVPDNQAEMLQIAYDTNERQLKIVNDLLNVARIDSNSYKINPQRTNLSELLDTIVRDQTTKFTEKNQTLALKRAAGAVYGRIDSDGLRMAIDNLLDNAHKYTPEGKSVRVTLQKHKKSALISVKDHGIGIAKSDLPKIFKLFTRVENPMLLQQEGTGLGLYWADRIVRLHKGKIIVSSEVKKGTTFTITLPL